MYRNKYINKLNLIRCTHVDTGCTHVIIGYTLTLLLYVQKLEIYKLEMYKTGNVQPRATEYTKTENVQI